MDGRRFDELTAALGRTDSRRQLVKAFIGGMLASLAGRTASAVGVAEGRFATQSTDPKIPNFPFLVALPTDPGLDDFALNFDLTGPPVRYRAIEAITSLPAQWRTILEADFRGAYASTIAAAVVDAPTTPEQSITSVLFDLGTEDAAVQAHADYVAAFLDNPAVTRLNSGVSNIDRIVLIGCEGGCEGLSSPAPSSQEPSQELSVIGQSGRFLFDSRVRAFTDQPIAVTQGESIALLQDAKLQAVGTATGLGTVGEAGLASARRPGVAPFAGGAPGGGRAPIRTAQGTDEIRDALVGANTLPIFGPDTADPPETADQWLRVDDGAIIVAFGETTASAVARQWEAKDVAYTIYSEQPLDLPTPYRGGYDLALEATQYAFRSEAGGRAFLEQSPERLERGREGIVLTEVESSGDQRGFVYEVPNAADGPTFGFKVDALVAAASFPALVSADLFAVPRSAGLPAISPGDLQAELGPIVGQILRVLADCLAAPETCPSSVPLTAIRIDQPQPTPEEPEPTPDEPEPTPTVLACAAGTVPCGGVCVDTGSDPANCGACGLDCGGLACCAGACVDLANDENYCGTCAESCPPGFECTDGICGCPAGRIPCDGACVDPTTDPSHCGDCGIACQPEEICSGGVCACADGSPTCGGVCCSPGLECVDGICLEPCPPGWIRCGGACVDQSSDPSNCGDCGITCGALTCCAGTCTDPLFDPANCGSCGQVCGAGSECYYGSCSSVVAAAPFGA